MEAIDVSLLSTLLQGEPLSDARYRGRRAACLENAHVRVTVLREGGHIAEMYDKATGVNPLWTPPWPTIEPSMFTDRVGTYGQGTDAKLLAGIAGHNLCLDIFGPPTDEEARAGLTAHGEAPVVPYEISGEDGETLVMRAQLPIAGLTVERQLTLRERALALAERVTNVSGAARQIGWTQHVTLGPPFLERGVTQFRASATRSKVFETAFGADDYLRPGAEFDWPTAPGVDGGSVDLRSFTNAARSSAFTAHLMDRRRARAYFVAFSPAFNLAFGYVWNPSDFPWLGIWEENHSRLHAPWNGQTLTRGMEFGVSPMPETRAAMIARDQLFGVPCFRTLAAGASISVEYFAALRPARAIPESFEPAGVIR